MTLRIKKLKWVPPGKDCGLCGCTTCDAFMEMVYLMEKKKEDCPYYSPAENPEETRIEMEAVYPEKDILNKEFDFVLTHLPGEISARKIVLPFRGDLVEKMNIKEGDVVLGRPMGAGCPIPHVLKVMEADPITGLLYTWVIGPQYTREGRPVKDVTAYHMIGFEGIAQPVKRDPVIGERQRFLPGFCMMSLGHTGVTNMILEKSCGLHVRIENIIIM
ncbi:MAG: Fe-S cluster protein [Clostridia bacterium]|nr:Fe-S cluster protein [Clostridia bacterium]